MKAVILQTLGAAETVISSKYLLKTRIQHFDRQIPELYEFDPKTVIEGRIGNTPEQVLKILGRVGVNPKVQELTPSERKVVDKALAR